MAAAIINKFMDIFRGNREDDEDYEEDVDYAEESEDEEEGHLVI